MVRAGLFQQGYICECEEDMCQGLFRCDVQLTAQYPLLLRLCFRVIFFFCHSVLAGAGFSSAVVQYVSISGSLMVQSVLEKNWNEGL